MNFLNTRKFRLICLILLGAAAPLPAGVIHRWSFTETSGPILDSAGTASGSVVVLGTNAIRTNGVIRLAGGVRTNADYVQFPGGLLHGGLSNVTVEVWAKPLSYPSWSRVFDFGAGNGTANDFFLSFCQGTSGNQQRMEYGAPAVWTLNTAVTSVTNVQYHYVATWSATGGPSGGGLAQWYRNGVLAGSIDTGTSTVSNVDDTVLWLGRSQYSGDSTANAEFDEVRMYDFALSQAQINLNFSNGPNTLVLLPPVASNDFMTLNPGAMALIDVLKNDVGQSAALDPSSVTIVTLPAAGTAVVKSGGKILYTQNGGLAVADQFTYTVKDLSGAVSPAATVAITINPALRLPNTTITVPNAPPVTAYQVVDAFPGLAITQPLALRTPRGAAYSNLLFMVERRGYVSYIDTSLTNPVRHVLLDISNQIQFDVSATDGEQGLLSVDFHPNFASNGLFFVSYIAPGGPYTERLSRFTADPVNLTANPGTQQILFATTKRAFNHNGGDLHFGLDGYLYMSMGDEGNQYNPYFNAQRIDVSVYSGILRLDVDKLPGNLEPNPPATSTPQMTIPLDGSSNAFYSIPLDNPFLGTVTNVDGTAVDTNHLRGEFYAIGMRHPWRFSIDPMSGEVWVGIVGQDRIEEVDVVRKGGNYGWPYFEGPSNTITEYGASGHPGLSNPPPGFVRDGPLWWYLHTSVASSDPVLKDPGFQGLDVNGSLVYHGNLIPALSNAYLFGDFDAGGNIWALQRVSNNVVTVERLGGVPGISAFGADPRNGDLLLCNYLLNKIQRLVVADVTGSSFPGKLSDTGIFADLTTLAPNPGIVAYSPNVAFWSDGALKTRWFTIPDTTNTVGFATETNWTLPTGMKWIKHFDLQMDSGNPASKRRIETRVLVKNAGGVYGVSYKWNDTQDDAVLVADGGDFFPLTVTNNGVPAVQNWEIPSRSSCLACHTPVAGLALTFNTRELNKTNAMNGVAGNQIATMSQGGYFTGPVPGVNTLPAHAAATDTNFSLEYRVRSYLSVNCVQCHQPGGNGQGNWDARAYVTLAQTGLINGTPVANNGGDPANKFIVPGDTNHSVLLMRLENTNNFPRMPPLATHQLDLSSIQLVQNWITQALPNELSYAQWIAQYPALTGPAADPAADPDGDGVNNFFEYLTGTDPTSTSSKWKLTLTVNSGQVQVSYPQVPNLGVVIETSGDLVNWTPWNVPGNQPVFASFATTQNLAGPLSSLQFFRARLVEP